MKQRLRPSADRLVPTAPDRVTSLVAVAAVCSPYDLDGAGEEKMLMGGFGAWLMKEMVRHTPKQTVTSLAKQVGDPTHGPRRGDLGRRRQAGVRAPADGDDRG